MLNLTLILERTEGFRVMDQFPIARLSGTAKLAVRMRVHSRRKAENWEYAASTIV